MKPITAASAGSFPTLAWVAFLVCWTRLVSGESVTLAWDRHASHTNLSAYLIKYGGSSGSYTGVTTLNTNITTATVSNLAPGRTYYFVVTARDASGLESDPSNEAFTNTPPRANRPPVANNSGLQAVEEQSLVVTLTGSDPDGDPLTYSVLTAPLHGTLSGIAPNLTYVAAANYFGSDSFTFSVNDGMTNSGVATISITVSPVNDAPTLTAIGNLTVAEDASQQTVNLSGISAGPSENQPLTIIATSSNPGLIPNPSVSYVSPSSAGSMTFTPVANANGNATITVTVNDGQGQNNTVVRSFVVTVTPVNDFPTLTSIADLSINEDASLQVVDLSGITSGAANENQNLTLIATSSNTGLVPHPTVGYSNPNASGSLAFRPVANASGTASITVTVNDGQSQSSTVIRTFTVTISPVNDLPTISNIADLSIQENAVTAVLPFTIADVETPVANLNVSVTSSVPDLVPNSSIVLGGVGTNRTIVITPVVNESGTTVITVSVSDGSGATASDSFNLTVAAVNQAPTLNALSNLTVNEDAGSQTVNLSGISSGAANELQILTVTAVSSDTGLIPHPSVSYTSPNPSGAIIFSPVANASGTATLSVTVSDGQTQVGRNFLVTVLPFNDAPSISDIPDQSITQNSATGTIPFTVGDAETAAGTLTLSALSSQPSLIPNGGIVLGGTGSSRTVRVTPSANQFGSALVTVTASDGNGGLSSDTFNVVVSAGNLPPTLDPLVDLAIAEDSGLQSVALSGITSGSANEVQVLVVSAVSSNPSLLPNPTVSYSSPNSTGILSFQSVTNAHGSALITVTVSDGQIQNPSVTRTFEVVVSPVNDAPSLNPIANVTLEMNISQHSVALSGISPGAANENQALTLTALSSDPSVVPNPTVNYFSPNTTGTLLLNLLPEVSGTATITVKVDDGQLENETLVRTFTVTIQGSNTPPVITDILDRSIAMGGSAVNFPFTVEDAETPAASLLVLGSSSNPSLVPTNNIILINSGSNRLASITPVAGQSGVAVITLTVMDSDGANASDSFVFNVVAPNSAPTLDSVGNLYLSEDSGSQAINLTGISDGSSSENQTLTFSAVSSNPSLVPHPVISYTNPNTTGSLTVTPVANGNGTAVISVTVNDGQSQNNLLTRVFSVTLGAINDAPTITTIPNQQLDHDTPTTALPFIVGDVETSPYSLGVTTSSSNPTLIPNGSILLGGSGANRTIKATPATGQSGTAMITIVVTDGSLSAGSSFLVSVGSTNTAPTLIAPSSLATDSYTPLQNVPLKVFDTESRPEDLVLTSTSYNQAVLPSTNITLSGTGSNRTVTFKPVSGKSGEVSISFAVTDGRALTRTLCQLTVQIGTPPKAKLNVHKKGRGTVQPSLDGQELTIGQQYTLKAVPASDEVFTGWTGSVTSPAPSVTFIMKSNLVLEAGFTNNPYLDEKGTYNGLFHEAAEIRQESSGSFTLTETDRGTFTGRLRTGARNYSLSGRLDLSCKATNILTRKGENALRVELDFSGGATNQVVGRVTDGIWEAPLLGDRSIFNARTNPSPYAGFYTMSVPGLDSSTTSPEGDSVASLKVDANGLVLIAGTLADGTKLAQRVSLSMAGQWPLYVPLYSGGGSVLSWLTITNRPAEDLTGLLSWIKPALPKSKHYSKGFTNETFATGSGYVSPAKSGQPILDLPTGHLVFSGGNLNALISHTISIDDASKVTNLSSNKLRMVFSTVNGLFSGTSTDPETGKVIKFSGTVLQKQNVGSGFLLGTNLSSRVALSE